jgi:ParB family chromosome partitioning protein
MAAKSFKRDPVLTIIGREDEQVRELPVDEIKTGEPFVSLLPIRDEIYQAILSSIKEHGYDKAQPLILWKERDILIDGHTRLKAAKEAGIEYIPVIDKPCKDEEAALDYVYKLQFARRNIRDGELVILAQKALEKYEKRYGEGGKADYLSKKFVGLSVGKAKKLIAVLDNASEVQMAEISEDNVTITAVYKNLKMVHVNHFDKPIENNIDVHDEELKMVHVNHFQEDKNSPNIVPKEESGSIKRPFQEYKADRIVQIESDDAADERRDEIQEVDEADNEKEIMPDESAATDGSVYIRGATIYISDDPAVIFVNEEIFSRFGKQILSLIAGYCESSD